MLTKKKLLIIGDSVTVSTGFAVVIQNLYPYLMERFEIVQLAINCYDMAATLNFPYKIIPANGVDPQDLYGFKMLPRLVQSMDFEYVLMNNDLPVCLRYLQVLKEACEQFNKPLPNTIGYVPVDGDIFIAQPWKEFLDSAKLVVYTNYGKNEIKKCFDREGVNFADYESKISIAGHSIDKSKFFPVDKIQARNCFAQKNENGTIDERIPTNAFVINWTNRNQPRKWLHHALIGCAPFLKRHADARLLIRASRNDLAHDFLPLAHWLGITSQLILVGPDIQGGLGVTVQELNLLYNASDVFLSTSITEGFGLTECEAAACRKPLILPDNTVRSELHPYAFLMRSDLPIALPTMCQSIGYLPNLDEIDRGLEYYYNNREKVIEDGDKCYNNVLNYDDWEVITNKIMNHF